MGVRVSNQRTLAWWLVDRILHLLDAEEREAVRGDLAESCDSAAQALRSVLRLVMHRQSVLWQHPRPWLVLFLFVMPLGVLLSLTSRSHAGLSAIYLWLIVNNANLSLLRSAGFWYTLLQVLPTLLLPSLSLGCVAWMAGVLLAGHRATHTLDQRRAALPRVAVRERLRVAATAAQSINQPTVSCPIKIREARRLN